MEELTVIVFVILYFCIGAFVVGLSGTDEPFAMFPSFLFWPLIPIVYGVGYVCHKSYDFGLYVKAKFTNVE